MKKIRDLTEQINIQSQDGKVLENMRPIMQEKAHNYLAAKSKNKRTILLAACIIAMITIVAFACCIPVASALNKKGLQFSSETSIRYAKLNFAEYFGESGSKGFYYYTTEDTGSYAVVESVSFDILEPNYWIYKQYFKTKRDEAEVIVYAAEKRENAILFGKTEWLKTGNHKGVDYYYAKEELIEGIFFTFSYGDYSYAIQWHDKSRDFTKIPLYLDLFLKF